MEYPNPIIDYGNPTSTAGLFSVIGLCRIQNLELDLHRPRTRYNRRWGPNGTNSSDVIASCTFYLQYINREPVTKILYFTNDDSLAIVGMDIKQHTITDNLATPPRMKLRKPTKDGVRILETYMVKNDPLRTRLRLLVVPTALSSALFGEARRPANMRPLTLAKRIHPITHAHPQQAIRICEDAGWLIPKLTDSIKDVSSNCPSCAVSGLPGPSKTISDNHVNEKFNE